MSEEIKYFSEKEISAIKEDCKNCERHTTSDLIEREDDRKGDSQCLSKTD